MPSYYLNGTSCQKCGEELCLICNAEDPSKCSYCSEGYDLNPDTQKCEQKCSDKFSNCLYCNDQSCNYCDKGYFLLANKCYSIDLYIPGCASLTSNFECYECLEGYQLQTSLSCDKSAISYIKFSAFMLLFILFILWMIFIRYYFINLFIF